MSFSPTSGRGAAVKAAWVSLAVLLFIAGIGLLPGTPVRRLLISSSSAQTVVAVCLLLSAAILFFIALPGRAATKKQKPRLVEGLSLDQLSFLQAAPDATIVADRTGKLVAANSQVEELFGYFGRELLSKKIEDLMPARFRSQHHGHRQGFFAEAKVRPMGPGLDLYGLHKDGHEFPVEISLSPVATRQGMLVVAAIRDITARKQIEQELERRARELAKSNGELEQFAYVASHDLQEPLRVVGSYAQLLARRYQGKLDPKADEFIAYIVDGSNRMKRLIQDLLLYARVTTRGKILTVVDSGKVLQEVMADLELRIKTSNAVVTFDRLPLVQADDVQLGQLLQNLIGNAIKYRGTALPAVHVSAEREPTGWRFSVADNGIGIEKQYLEQIFEIFQRLHGIGEYEGTGIGLAVCKKIVERHGGRIWAESEPGHGSTFFFTLPAALEESTAISGEPVSAHTGDSHEQ